MSDVMLPPLPAIPHVEVRHIPGWPGYAVSDDGRVWSCRAIGCKKGFTLPWRQLKGGPTKGYISVVLCDGQKKKRSHLINVLVLLAFCGPPLPGQEACHNNGNRKDNRLDNLRWDSRYGNIQDAIAHGVFPQGETNGQSKLTKTQILEIRALSAMRMPQEHIAKLYNVTRANISAIVTKRSWK